MLFPLRTSDPESLVARPSRKPYMIKQRLKQTFFVNFRHEQIGPQPFCHQQPINQVTDQTIGNWYDLQTLRCQGAGIPFPLTNSGITDMYRRERTVGSEQENQYRAKLIILVALSTQLFIEAGSWCLYIQNLINVYRFSVVFFQFIFIPVCFIHQHFGCKICRNNSAYMFQMRALYKRNNGFTTPESLTVFREPFLVSSFAYYCRIIFKQSAMLSFILSGAH